MTDVTDYSAHIGQAQGSSFPLRVLVTTIGAICSGIFIGVCWYFYWFIAIPAVITSYIIPRKLIERASLAWLISTSIGVAFLTQTIDTFFPNYLNPRDILLEIALWFGLGLFVRAYLVYTELPETFEGLRASIASRRIERWFSKVLPNSIDAIFVRIWLGNSIAIIPVSVVLFLPWTVNYFVVLAYSAVLLLIQFPNETIDHNHIHYRIFNPKPDAPPFERNVLRACRFYFENVLCILSARIPDFYRIQHVYVHHVEDNGPDDSQTTMPYDRTSFFDFSRHALRQGLDLVSGFIVIPYLRRRGKSRQLREFLRGIAIWYAFLIVLAIFNPIASALIFFSRLLGGNIQSIIAFYQHGVIDASNVYDVRGNTMDYHHTDHGNLGDDYHVEHHLKPARHWSKYYEEFQRESAHEHGHQSFVMKKDMVTPLAFAGALWKKDYDAIARYTQIRAGGNDPSKIAELVRARTRPIGEAELTGLPARLDAIAGRIAGWAVVTSFASCGLN
jgi:hypothetical protein